MRTSYIQIIRCHPIKSLTENLKLMYVLNHKNHALRSKIRNYNYNKVTKYLRCVDPFNRFPPISWKKPENIIRTLITFIVMFNMVTIPVLDERNWNFKKKSSHTRTFILCRKSDPLIIFIYIIHCHFYRESKRVFIRNM